MNLNLTEKIKEAKHYFAELFILMLPILMGNMGHTLIGASDILVVARYNINSLAAISIANAILFTIFIFGLATLDATTIILSNLRGQRNKIKMYLPSSLVFSLFMAFLYTAICYSSKYLIDYMGFEQSLIPLIKEYISIVSFSMFGMFIFQGIKQFLQAYEIVKLPNLIIICTVLVNLILNIIFVFGFGSIPAMGSKGAAIATLCTRSLMGIVLFMFIYKAIDFKYKIDFEYMKQLIKVGTPIGLALLLEFLAFNIITVLIGREAGILSAVHNILITISSTTFMVPLSIATALAIKVSYNYGANKPKEIRKYSYAALITGVGFMALASLILIIYPDNIIRLFTSSLDVHAIAIPLVIIVGIFQVFDGFQVIAGGILKGFKKTKTVSFCVLSGYWLIGVPVAYMLVYRLNYSLKGYWIALAVSLLFMGIFQAMFAKNKYNKFCRKISLEHDNYI